MSKSLGNTLTIKNILSKYSADALRVFVMSGHYRSPLTYSEEILEGAGRGAERLRQAARAAAKEGSVEGEFDLESYRQRFIEAMEDDFNSPQAVAVLFDLAKQINRQIETGLAASAGQQLLIELAGIMGLTLKLPETKVEAAPFIEQLIATRKQLREAKQYQLADNIRQKLDEMGIILEDTSQGTAWKAKG